MDQALLELRRKQEAEHPGLMLDFYDPPLDTQWKKSASPKGGAEDEVEAEETEPSDAVEEPQLQPTQVKQAINRIFYGPPGTGKSDRSPMRLRSIQCFAASRTGARFRMLVLRAMVQLSVID